MDVQTDVRGRVLVLLVQIDCAKHGAIAIVPAKMWDSGLIVQCKTHSDDCLLRAVAAYWCTDPCTVAEALAYAAAVCAKEKT